MMQAKNIFSLKFLLASWILAGCMFSSAAKQPQGNANASVDVAQSVNCSANDLEILQRCLDSAKPGEVIELLPGRYEGGKPLTWSHSGKRLAPITLQGAGPEATGGDWGRSVLKVYKKWPNIKNFSMDFQGHDYIVVKRLRISNILDDVAFKLKETENVSISNLYIAGGGKNTTEFFSAFGGAKQLSLSKIYATQVGKRFLRGQPLIDSRITDTYADAMINGKPSDNWTFLYHFEDGSKNITLERTIGKNPAETSRKYDNGDCYATEKTESISFSRAWCFDAMDSGFDIKGKNHKIDRGIVIRSGNHAYRIWSGPVKITNSVSIFGGKGKYTCKASHGHSTLWKKSNTVSVYGDEVMAINPGKKCFSTDKSIARDLSIHRLEKNQGITLF
jgi:hypothetical protein